MERHIFQNTFILFHFSSLFHDLIMTQWFLFSFPCFNYDTMVSFKTCFISDTMVSFKTCFNYDTMVSFKTCFNYDTMVSFKTCFNYDTMVSFKTCFNYDTMVLFKTCFISDTMVSFKTCFISSLRRRVHLNFLAMLEQILSWFLLPVIILSSVFYTTVYAGTVNSFEDGKDM